jgi:hypothetical protein
MAYGEMGTAQGNRGMDKEAEATLRKAKHLIFHRSCGAQLSAT